MTYNNYTTNRILEIPQNIKLELNNGTLTLKAGSKVYVPNGFEEDGTTPKFDAVTIERGVSRSSFGNVTASKVFFYVTTILYHMMQQIMEELQELHFLHMAGFLKQIATY